MTSISTVADLPDIVLEERDEISGHGFTHVLFGSQPFLATVGPPKPSVSQSPPAPPDLTGRLQELHIFVQNELKKVQSLQHEAIQRLSALETRWAARSRRGSIGFLTPALNTGPASRSKGGSRYSPDVHKEVGVACEGGSEVQPSFIVDTVSTEVNGKLAMPEATTEAKGPTQSFMELPETPSAASALSAKKMARDDAPSLFSEPIRLRLTEKAAFKVNPETGRKMGSSSHSLEDGFAISPSATEAPAVRNSSQSEEVANGRLSDWDAKFNSARSRSTLISQNLRGAKNRTTAVTKPPVLPNDGGSGFVSYLVQHPCFDVASALLVFGSTILAGVETDYIARREDGQTSPVFEELHKYMFGCFTAELVLRVWGHKSEFFCNKLDRWWNLFDSFIVVTGALDLFFSNANLGDVSETTKRGKAVRVARLLRILKCVRLGRIMRYAHTFRQIVYSLKASVKTLIWTVTIVFLLLYCFAIFFCQGTTDFINDAKGRGLYTAGFADETFELREMYGTMPAALYSLYKTFTGGQSWGELLAPLSSMGWIYVCFFMGFITLTFFGVLNVVAAIFVESALQSQQHHKDLLTQDRLLKKQMYTEHLKEVFHAIDQDRSGFINADEMEFFLGDPELNLYLESIDIFPNDARTLFRLLDTDDSGEISIEEFCEGCLRLKGEAKSFDIHCMIYNNMVLIRRTQRIMDYLEQRTS